MARGMVYSVGSSDRNSLGILVTRVPRLNKLVLGSANIIQTIPKSWRFLVFCFPHPGLGSERIGWRFSRLCCTHFFH